MQICEVFASLNCPKAKIWMERSGIVYLLLSESRRDRATKWRRVGGRIDIDYFCLERSSMNLAKFSLSTKNVFVGVETV